jgi:hypothetical protein
VSGTVISYQQDIFAPYAGLGCTVFLLPQLTASIGVGIAPWIFITGTDTHHFRMIQFRDIMNGPYALEGYMEIVWELLPSGCFALRVGGTYIPELVGHTVSKSAYSDTWVSDIATYGGSSYHAVSAALSYRWYILDKKI